MESATTLTETRDRPRALPTRADYRSLMALAIPVVVVQVGLMAMGVVDTIMVGHVSAADLAATALGSLYFFGVTVFGFGMLMALDPVVSQAMGAGDTPAVARAMQRGLVLVAVLSLPLSVLLMAAEPFFRFFGQPEDIVPLAGRFVRISTPGIVAFLSFVVLRQSLQAMGRLRPVVITILAANVVNALLCWLLVFGHAGETWRGAPGAALATVLARWAMVLGLLLVAWSELRPTLRPFRRDALELRPLLRMVRLGAPIGAQFQLEFGVFAVVALLMGRLGTVPMAAHQVAINIASFTFMVPLGIAGAASVLVGQAVGAADPWRARRAATASLVVGFAFMALSGALLFALPRPLAMLYSLDASVVTVAMSLIPLAGLFQVFDGIQVVSIGILRGVGDTRAPMIVNVLGFWLIGFPVSLWLGFKTGAGAVGLWWGLVVGLAAVALFLLARVRSRLSRDLARIVIDEEAPAG